MIPLDYTSSTAPSSQSRLHKSPYHRIVVWNSCPEDKRKFVSFWDSRDEPFYGINKIYGFRFKSFHKH